MATIQTMHADLKKTEQAATSVAMGEAPSSSQRRAMPTNVLLPEMQNSTIGGSHKAECGKDVEMGGCSNTFEIIHLTLNRRQRRRLRIGRALEIHPEPGPSLIPGIFFKSMTLNIILKLWGPRLCPDGVDSIVHEILAEIHDRLSYPHHQMICVTAWIFQANPMNSVNWELYQFVFHHLQTEARVLFGEMQKGWNATSSSKLSIQQVKERWQNMVWAIGEWIKESLFAKKYHYCSCSIRQPHSDTDLQMRVMALERLDKDQRMQKAQHVIAAYQSFRAFDMINADLKHASWQYCRFVVNDALEELQDGQGLSEDVQAQLEEIIMYENN